jgi:transcriptional regulator with XRE-family HTH domain
MTADPTLSGELRSARLAAGLSIAELARRAKTSRAAITTYESGTVSPSLATAQRVLAATGHALAVVPLPNHLPGVCPRLDTNGGDLDVTRCAAD